MGKSVEFNSNEGAKIQVRPENKGYLSQWVSFKNISKLNPKSNLPNLPLFSKNNPWRTSVKELEFHSDQKTKVALLT